MSDNVRDGEAVTDSVQATPDPASGDGASDAQADTHDRR